MNASIIIIVHSIENECINNNYSALNSINNNYSALNRNVLTFISFSARAKKLAGSISSYLSR